MTNPRPNADRNRVGKAAVALMGTGLVAIAVLGGLLIWHLVRRGRLLRERLGPPKPMTLDEPERLPPDVIEKVPTRSIGTGQFVIGTSKVRPRVGETFRRDEKMGIYLQLYNFATDEKNKKPTGTVEYEVIKAGTNEKVFDFTEDIEKIEGASSQQVVIEKVLPLQNMEPGQYMLRMKVTDKLGNQTLSPSATFTIV
jgi:hypothetical protein